MKYFSELTKETYNSPEACLEAEKNYKAQQQKIEADLKRTSSAISKEKRELSKAIEDADNKLTEANKLYRATQLLPNRNHSLFRCKRQKCQHDKVWQHNHKIWVVPKCLLKIAIKQCD